MLQMMSSDRDGRGRLLRRFNLRLFVAISMNGRVDARSRSADTHDISLSKCGMPRRLALSIRRSTQTSTIVLRSTFPRNEASDVGPCRHRRKRTCEQGRKRHVPNGLRPASRQSQRPGLFRPMGFALVSIHRSWASSSHVALIRMRPDVVIGSRSGSRGEVALVDTSEQAQRVTNGGGDITDAQQHRSECASCQACGIAAVAPARGRQAGLRGGGCAHRRGEVVGQDLGGHVDQQRVLRRRSRQAHTRSCSGGRARRARPTSC